MAVTRSSSLPALPNIQQFGWSADRLSNINFAHHQANECVCSDCICGRHLCNLHPTIKPDFPLKSTYQQQFQKKLTFSTLQQKHQPYPKLQGPLLDTHSSYLRNYLANNTQNVTKFKPVDQLKVGGPLLGLSTYNSNFPGHKCGNQYVKPLPDISQGGMPFSAKTTYGTSFSNTQPPKKRQIINSNIDNLKTSNINFINRTSYQNFFKKPNPEDYPPIKPHQQKLDVDPNQYVHQYQTTYKNDFEGKNSKVCPAKVKLQTKLKNSISNSIGKFNQNADFKAISKDYHALSTSKQHQ